MMSTYDTKAENADETDAAIHPASISCWVVTEGHAGTENQCLGVCEALGITPDIKRIMLREPWKTLSPAFRLGRAWAVSSKGDALKPPFPDLVIAAGRKAVIAALHIKKASKGQTMVVFLQDPLISPKYFDLVCVPFHDSLRGANVLVTEGAPNRVFYDNIKDTPTPYDKVMQALPSPRVSVFIGGNSKRHTLPDRHADELCRMLKRMQDDYGAGLMISASRRTPASVHAILEEHFTDTRDTFYWNGEGDNPYQAMFKFADAFIITEDSISMLSEAATTGQPVYRAHMKGQAGKFESFFTYMEERNTIRPFTGTLDQWSYRPLKDAELIANVIRSELAARKTNR